VDYCTVTASNIKNIGVLAPWKKRSERAFDERQLVL
jgi:hypothetical protein